MARPPYGEDTILRRKMIVVKRWYLTALVELDGCLLLAQSGHRHRTVAATQFARKRHKADIRLTVSNVCFWG
jgi:hypothetical protein